MRQFLIVYAATVVLATAAVVSEAQGRSAQLSRVTQLVESAVREKMPGWHRQPGVPMTAGDVVSDQVAVDYWRYGDAVIKVTILSHSSEEEASGVMNRYPNEKGRGNVEAFGDEAATLNDGEIIAFRKQNLTIYVVELGEGRFRKDSALVREFAAQIADALPKPRR